jgi:adenine deaminase
MLREGSLRQDLEATLKPLIDRNINFQRLILVTDSMSPDDVEEVGHMDHVIRRAVAMGLSPMQAIQAVTLNPATYSGLEQEIGGIGPGRFADLVLMEDLENFRVCTTLVGGKVVAAKGVSSVKANPIPLPGGMTDSLRLIAAVSPRQFKIPCASATATIRVMELINQTITAERIVSVSVPAGFIEANLYDDLLKVAIFERHSQDKQIALGFVKGFGAKIGAVGTTANLDENTLMVAGASDDDMAICANVLVKCGGGMAIVNQSEVLDEIAFPVGGVFSMYRWQEVAKRLRRFQRLLRERGSTFEKPMYALSFLTFVTLPALRITARGLVNVKERKIVSLLAS